MSGLMRALNFAGVLTSTSFFTVSFITAWFKGQMVIHEPSRIILSIEVFVSLLFAFLCSKVAWKELMRAE